MGVEVVAYYVGLLIQFLGYAILVRSLLSWFPIDPNGPVVQAIVAITEPILEPLRRVIPPIGMIDITPMIAMLALLFVGNKLMAY